MKTKEIVNIIRQIKDYQAAYFDINNSSNVNEFQSVEKK